MEFMFVVYVCKQVKKTIPQNIIISCLSINSIQNKLNDLKFSISDSVDDDDDDDEVLLWYG